ncbi:MFS transporter [Paenibacillus flagellatus]|uniref:MFS transporter n=1 Tax=Paenibacillus flagellatus TaxID=2211139 RepID=A0A2V5JZ79_9BACL|nr:MFS transporter [Paenibacillus flagellatus]PYI50493.1 MFS transporter [Paenibacillus flagellatus]
MKHLFGNRVIRLLLGNDLLDNIAIWIRNIAVLFLVMDKTGDDPVAVSLITVAEYAPIFLFSMIGGTLADRWEPRRTMMAGGLLSAASVAAIALAVRYGAWETVFLATAVSAIVSQFSQPSSFVIIKRHLKEEQIAAATGLGQSMAAIFLIAGPVIGTAVYARLGIEASLLLVAALFLASTLLVFWLPRVPRETDAERSGGLWSDMREGVRFVLRDARLKTLLLLFALLGIGTGLIQPLDIFIVTDRLALDKEQVQWFYLVSGVGLLGGGVLAAVTAGKTRPNGHWLVAGGLGFLAVSIVVEAWSVWVPVTLVSRFLVGIAMAFMQTALSAMMIRMIDEAYVGRINGTLAPIMTGTLLAGSALAGPLLKATSLLAVFALAAGIVAVAAFCALRLKDRPSAVEAADRA